MTRPRKPVTTTRTYGVGSAARMDAARKGKVAASKAKLDALNARLADEADPRPLWWVVDVDGVRHCLMFGMSAAQAEADAMTAAAPGFGPYTIVPVG